MKPRISSLNKTPAANSPEWDKKRSSDYDDMFRKHFSHSSISEEGSFDSETVSSLGSPDFQSENTADNDELIRSYGFKADEGLKNAKKGKSSWLSRSFSSNLAQSFESENSVSSRFYGQTEMDSLVAKVREERKRITEDEEGKMLHYYNGVLKQLRDGSKLADNIYYNRSGVKSQIFTDAYLDQIIFSINDENRIKLHDDFSIDDLEEISKISSNHEGFLHYELFKMLSQTMFKVHVEDKILLATRDLVTNDEETADFFNVVSNNGVSSIYLQDINLEKKTVFEELFINEVFSRLTGIHSEIVDPYKKSDLKDDSPDEEINDVNYYIPYHVNIVYELLKDKDLMAQEFLSDIGIAFKYIKNISNNINSTDIRKNIEKINESKSFILKNIENLSKLKEKQDNYNNEAIKKIQKNLSLNTGSRFYGYQNVRESDKFITDLIIKFKSIEPYSSVRKKNIIEWLDSHQNEEVKNKIDSYKRSYPKLHDCAQKFHSVKNTGDEITKNKAEAALLNASYDSVGDDLRRFCMSFSGKSKITGPKNLLALVKSNVQLGSIALEKYAHKIQEIEGILRNYRHLSGSDEIFDGYKKITFKNERLTVLRSIIQKLDNYFIENKKISLNNQDGKSLPVTIEIGYLHGLDLRIVNNLLEGYASELDHESSIVVQENGQVSMTLCSIDKNNDYPLESVDDSRLSSVSDQEGEVELLNIDKLVLESIRRDVLLNKIEKLCGQNNSQNGGSDTKGKISELVEQFYKNFGEDKKSTNLEELLVSRIELLEMKDEQGRQNDHLSSLKERNDGLDRQLNIFMILIKKLELEIDYEIFKAKKDEQYHVTEELKVAIENKITGGDDFLSTDEITVNLISDIDFLEGQKDKSLSIIESIYNNDDNLFQNAVIELTKNGADISEIPKLFERQNIDYDDLYNQIENFERGNKEEGKVFDFSEYLGTKLALSTNMTNQYFRVSDKQQSLIEILDKRINEIKSTRKIQKIFRGMSGRKKYEDVRIDTIKSRISKVSEEFEKKIIYFNSEISDITKSLNILISKVEDYNKKLHNIGKNLDLNGKEFPEIVIKQPSYEEMKEVYTANLNSKRNEIKPKVDKMTTLKLEFIAKLEMITKEFELFKLESKELNDEHVQFKDEYEGVKKKYTLDLNNFMNSEGKDQSKLLITAKESKEILNSNTKKRQSQFDKVENLADSLNNMVIDEGEFKVKIPSSLIQANKIARVKTDQQIKSENTTSTILK